MLLMIDNYDSFTYNLVQYFQELGEEVQVVRNDEATVEELLKRKPDRAIAKVVKIPLGKTFRRHAVHFKPPRIGSVESAQYVQKRALPAA